MNGPLGEQLRHCPSTGAELSTRAQFLWVEGTLSTLERLALSSFRDFGYEVILYHYNKVAGVPSGVFLRDGREILPDDRLLATPSLSGKSYAAFADLFRYQLLSTRGGWWFDADIVCVAPPAPQKDLLFASTWEGAYGECANNCAMFAQPHDPVILELARRCDEMFDASVSFGATGPHLVQSTLRAVAGSYQVAPWWAFCPYPWRMVYRAALPTALEWVLDRLRQARQSARELTDPSFRRPRIRKATRAVHLHNEIWKQRGLDKDAKYFRWCLYEKLKRKHLTESVRSSSSGKNTSNPSRASSETPAI